MISAYNGHYSYNQNVVAGWNASPIGVYFCGKLNAVGNLVPHYIGSATGESGIQGRLLDHLREDRWPDVTHFGYFVCATASEAEQYELQQIRQYGPKYNVQGVIR